MRYKLKNPIIPMQVKQFNGNNLDEICDLLIRYDWDIGRRDYENGRIDTENESGDLVHIHVGDYVVYFELSDSLCVIKESRFESIYEPIK